MKVEWLYTPAEGGNTGSIPVIVLYENFPLGQGDKPVA
jgi:hypothetical protein